MLLIFSRIKKGNNRVGRYGYFKSTRGNPSIPSGDSIAPSSSPSLPPPRRSLPLPLPVPWSQTSSQTPQRNAGRVLLVYRVPNADGQSPSPQRATRSHRLSSSLKLRCDRNVPCGSCVKRGCGAICPDGTSSSPSFLSFLGVIPSALQGSLTTGQGNRYVSIMLLPFPFPQESQICPRFNPRTPRKNICPVQSCSRA